MLLDKLVEIVPGEAKIGVKFGFLMTPDAFGELAVPQPVHHRVEAVVEVRGGIGELCFAGAVRRFPCRP